MYRLTQVTYPGPTTDTYTYDANGNRLAKNATSYSYDDADELTAAGGMTYGYDGNGNQTSRGADAFTFDHENRLTAATVGGVGSSSVYYGSGVRRSHTVNGSTTTYVWDTVPKLPAVLQDGSRTYVYGLDLISATDGSGSQTYFSYDALGSTTDLTNGTGTVTDSYSYDVFGAVKTHTGSSASYWLFTGEQADSGTGDTGYYFLRARYLDTATGRFVSKDAVEFDQRYAYARNNPALLVDPSGQVDELPARRDFCDEVIICGGGGGGGGGGTGGGGGGRGFDPHAIDRMNGSRGDGFNATRNQVDKAIENGFATGNVRYGSDPGTWRVWDPVSGIVAAIESATGRVITAYFTSRKPW